MNAKIGSNIFNHKAHPNKWSNNTTLNAEIPHMYTTTMSRATQLLDSNTLKNFISHIDIDTIISNQVIN